MMLMNKTKKTSTLNQPWVSGFSLVELAVVLLIISVLLSAFVFSYGRFLKSVSAERAARNTVAVLSQARDISVNRTNYDPVSVSGYRKQVISTLVYFSNDHSGGITRPNIWMSQKLEVRNILDSTDVNTTVINQITGVHYLPDGVLFRTLPAVIEFYPDGSASRSEMIEIIANPNERAGVQLYQSTGRAKVITYSEVSA